LSFPKIDTCISNQTTKQSRQKRLNEFIYDFNALQYLLNPKFVAVDPPLLPMVVKSTKPLAAAGFLVNQTAADV